MEEKQMEKKIQEFRIWAMTIGRYSPSTVKRSLRRVRSFSRVIDIFDPDQAKILDYFAAEI